MTVKINADTTNGAVITSDTSGEIELQAGGVTKMSVTSSGVDGTNLTNIPAANLTGSLPSGMGGKILQVVTNRSDTRTVYTGNNNYSISELTTTITPVSSSSLLMIDMHIHYEGNDSNQVFKATKDGSVMTASGYEGYNSAVGNQRYSGLTGIAYDGNYNNTPTHTVLRFFDAAGSTTSRTYGIDARTSDSSNASFYLNRTVSSAGADTHEIGVSFVTIMEIAQ